jgi:hypothetical protein
MHFCPSIIFASRAGSLPLDERSLRGFTVVGLSLFQTRVEMNGMVNTLAYYDAEKIRP